MQNLLLEDTDNPDSDDDDDDDDTEGKPTAAQMLAGTVRTVESLLYNLSYNV